MHYTIIRGDEETAYELERGRDGRLYLSSNDGRVGVDLRHLPDGDVHLLIDGRSYDLSVNLDGHEAICALEGQTLDLHVYNDRQLRLLRLEEASGAGFTPEVRSPMAGKVIAVQVEPGQLVDEHDALVVVEAMKMENIIRAEQAGRVERVAVTVDEAVEPGQTLVVLSPIEGGE